ncbi:BTB/POZ domain-containing protein KCTD19 [Pogona vitticeps]
MERPRLPLPPPLPGHPHPPLRRPRAERRPNPCAPARKKPEGRARPRRPLSRPEREERLAGMEEPAAPPPEPPGAREEGAAEEAEEEEAEEAPKVQLNVGGWDFSVPRRQLAQFPDSLLWEAVASSSSSPPSGPAGLALPPEDARWFLDRDGGTFRHVHYYLHTGRLSCSSCAELSLLYEQAALLRLGPLLQTLDNLKEGKHNLRIRPADIPIAERASMNYWRTRKCISKPAEFPLKSPTFTGLQEKAPLGLMDTPLLDTEDEVHYCFLPLEQVEKHPSLVTDDNLLWLCDNAVVIECEGSEFRFIANFLRSEKILLPDNFSSMEVLEAEAEALGIPEVMEAVKSYRSNPGVGHSSPYGPFLPGFCPEERADDQGSVRRDAEGQRGAPKAARRPLPLYPMALGLLVKYPDSALGQLHVEGTLDGNRLYLSGNGVLFQHVTNWLGTCRLPLTRNISELPKLCAYLDQMDAVYEPMKDALKIYLKERMPTGAVGKGADWTAEMAVFPLHHIVKVYVGSHWYATYLQTLLKFPELLSNCRKASWIAYGQSLLIHGDGQMFRHVLNFLRLGKLFLPSDFKEWSLLRQEVMEYQIPSLVEALCQYDTHRLRTQPQDAQSEAFPFRNLEISVSEKEDEAGENPQECSHIVLDLDQGARDWRANRDAEGMKEGSGENEKSPGASPTKAAKRSNPWEAGPPPLDSWGHPCSGRQPESPPRKRGQKGNVTKRSDARDTPIQRLISLVQGWDMVSRRLHEAGPVPAPSGIKAEEEPRRRAPCPSPAGGGLEPSCHGLVIQAAPKAGPSLPAPSGREGWRGQTGSPSLAEERTTTLLGPEPRSRQRGKGTFPEDGSAAAAAAGNPQGKAGLILKLEHPPVVAADGSCMAHEGSILYSTCLEDMKLASSLAPPEAQEVVFLSFPLSQEEIFYARKCHAFLTDVILDSIRQKDSRETTAKVEGLVQRLWSLQISAEEFVAGLLGVAPFRAKSQAKSHNETFTRWIEFTLPFAWKYSCCMDLLIKKGYFKSLSLFMLEKYLHKPQ